MFSRVVTGLVLLLLLASQVGAKAQTCVDDALAVLRGISEGYAVRDWKYEPSDVPGAESPDFDDSAWRTASPELIWGQQPVAWLRKAITMPERIAGVPVAGKQISFCAGVDDAGECYVNGELKQKFNWGDCRVVLTESARPGEKFTIALNGINTGGAGKLLFSRLEVAAIAGMPDEAGKAIKELELYKLVVDVESDKGRQQWARKSLAAAVESLDIAALHRGDTDTFTKSFSAFRERLKPLDRLLKAYTLHLVGHAHIDMNWLWLWPETVDVCKNTFSTMLKIMAEYPEFRFSQSQASAYLPIEEQYPELFAKIQEAVKSGQWEITAGTWTEGDMNMVSGEAIVRQVLYANRYFKEKFNVEPVVCWEPDTFGHAWTVPQILAKSGLKYYFFTRCGKGEQTFWWEAPDGSRVLACHRGSYGEVIGRNIMNSALDQAEHYGVRDGMVVYGVGDHGGGPTREHIRKALELQKRLDYPTVKFDTAEGFFKSLLAQKKDFPVIRDELNFIFEGCYTTHADIKKMNRVSENLLPAAEMFSALAGRYGFTYPHTGFVQAWRNTCFNQFHDIFDGSAIHGSYDYSRELFDKAYGIGEDALSGSMSTIAENVDTNGDGMPVVVFNPLSWKRTDVVRIGVPASIVVADLPDGLQGKAIRAVDARGREMPADVIGDQVIFTAKDVPPLGYKVFYLSRKPASPSHSAQAADTIENEFFIVRVDPASGTVAGIYDKRARREVLAHGQKADVLQLLFESPHWMSAWKLGWNGRVEELLSASSVEKVADGPCASTIRVKHEYNKSTFSQDITLYAGVPRIDFKLTADWYEQGDKETDFPMLKVAFPVNVTDGKATFEIPFGSIERPANGNEVPAQKWIDLSAGDYGVGLLNDCKYGHDVSGTTMRLSLLRCSYDPDPKPDQGRHEIVYSLYPHTGDWRKADTVRRGYELNNPLVAVLATKHAGRLPKEHSFIRVEPSNLVVTALKRAEDSGDLILRFYESQGKRGAARIRFGMGVKSVCEADLMERPLNRLPIPVTNGWISIPFGKWEIKTLKLSVE
ncbi:MAG TPA: glycoside hydrolase family 38 C-terminal domain-containing protein [Armatimonadota bacterium]|nr:glycoside hydrolase family 38 C-terminal domain-containing protein [Armatimonadota bacterium]